ncbi:unnamed protein product [Prunus brigantina]
MAWLPFGSWSSNREKDGHSRLLGGLVNLLDGCTVRYFDQVGALSSGGTERKWTMWVALWIDSSFACYSLETLMVTPLWSCRSAS